MRRLAALANSLEGRTVTVLMLAILAVHLGALALYHQSAMAAADEAVASEVGKQLALAREAVLRRPAPARGEEAEALSTAHFEIGWALEPTQRPAMAPALWALRNRVLASEPSLGSDLTLSLQASSEPLHPQDLLGNLRLPDGTFLTFRSPHAPSLVRLMPWALLSTAMAIAVGGAAVAMTHRIAGPLRDLTGATGRIGRGVAVSVPEKGPAEVKGIGQALNAMQSRIHHLVGERTQALAAVSHDLRTPLARLRLRLDRLPDDDEKAAMASDLDDMQSMVDSTLAYLRGDADPETRRVTNVASLVSGVADASADTGQDVSYRGPARVLALVRPVAFRRAVENLVDNALRYGARARLELEAEGSRIRLRIDDDGPGIAAEDVERAFAPFTRLETSRNRGTGGTGLGLTLARRAVEAEGGTIGLHVRPEGGLRVEISLPASGAAPPDTLRHEPATRQAT